MGKPTFDDLFTSTGRRNRKSYILYCLALTAMMMVVVMIGAGIVASDSKGRGDLSAGSIIVITVLGIAFLIMAISSWMVGAQRCRDF